MGRQALKTPDMPRFDASLSRKQVSRLRDEDTSVLSLDRLKRLAAAMGLVRQGFYPCGTKQEYCVA